MTVHPVSHKGSSDLAAVTDIAPAFPRQWPAFPRPWKDSILALREALIRRIDAAKRESVRVRRDRSASTATSPSFESSTRRILSAQEFQSLLERERELANRGTRCFSLIALRRLDGSARGFERLAREVRERLRSTDLVGRVAADRIELLLADTGPVGACVVADWIDRLVIELGIHVEPKLFVYPSETDDGEDDEPSDRPQGGHRANGNGDRRSSIDPGLRGPSRHIEDLWRHFAVETPFAKRCVDVIASSIALVLLLPVFLIVAIAIRLDSPGPVIFKQKRAGRSGKPFVFYKFRSMFVDAERRRDELASLNEQTGPIFKMRNDPRMTRVGRALRRWSIDELPQLWNVLKGDLSLVGPRSPTFDEYRCYERWERERLRVTGGITCIWQVSGRSEVSFRDWMRMDMRYIACRGLWFDLCLLARTVPAVLSGRGAY